MTLVSSVRPRQHRGGRRDAYGDFELQASFEAVIEEHLALPFSTLVLGTEVIVERVETTDDDRIVAVCRRGRSRQRIGILDLPLPDPPPDGAESMEAYRRAETGTMATVEVNRK